MPRHPERQRLVDVAVRVRQGDVEGVDRRGERHAVASCSPGSGGSRRPCQPAHARPPARRGSRAPWRPRWGRPGVNGSAPRRGHLLQSPRARPRPTRRRRPTVQRALENPKGRALRVSHRTHGHHDGLLEHASAGDRRVTHLVGVADPRPPGPELDARSLAAGLIGGVPLAQVMERQHHVIVLGAPAASSSAPLERPGAEGGVSRDEGRKNRCTTRSNGSPTSQTRGAPSG